MKVLQKCTGQGDDYTNGCFLDYPYLKEKYKWIAINNKHLIPIKKETQQTSLLKILTAQRYIYDVMFIFEEVEETILYILSLID